MPDPAKPSTYEVARRGVELVEQELRARGARHATAAPDRGRNALRVRLAEGGERVVLVKTRRVGDWQSDTNLGRPRGEDPHERTFSVFVDLQEEPPAFYVAPEWWVQNDIHRDDQAYRARYAGSRRDNPASTHRRITTKRIERWRDRWDLLGLR